MTRVDKWNPIRLYKSMFIIHFIASHNKRCIMKGVEYIQRFFHMHRSPRIVRIKENNTLVPGVL